VRFCGRDLLLPHKTRLGALINHADSFANRSISARSAARRSRTAWHDVLKDGSHWSRDWTSTQKFVHLIMFRCCVLRETCEHCCILEPVNVSISSVQPSIGRAGTYRQLKTTIMPLARSQTPNALISGLQAAAASFKTVSWIFFSSCI
jgi:hypothetical protein